MSQVPSNMRHPPRQKSTRAAICMFPGAHLRHDSRHSRCFATHRRSPSPKSQVVGRHSRLLPPPISRVPALIMQVARSGRELKRYLRPNSRGCVQMEGTCDMRTAPRGAESRSPGCEPWAGRRWRGRRWARQAMAGPPHPPGVHTPGYVIPPFQGGDMDRFRKREAGRTVDIITG